MKKIAAVLIIVAFLFAVTGCGDSMIIDGKKYETYGILNQEDVKDPYIKYEPIWGNIIWGAVLIETIIAPIYFYGFSMFEPVGKKDEGRGKP